MSDELEAQLRAEREAAERQRQEREAAFQRELAEAKRILEQNGGPNG
jgi:hypothetical protein